jgi:hypothetical protein
VNTAAEVVRPRYMVLPLKRAQAADWRGWHVSQKLDGQWHEHGIGRAETVWPRPGG